MKCKAKTTRGERCMNLAVIDGLCIIHYNRMSKKEKKT